MFLTACGVEDISGAIKDLDLALSAEKFEPAKVVEKALEDINGAMGDIMEAEPAGTEQVLQQAINILTHETEDPSRQGLEEAAHVLANARRALLLASSMHSAENLVSA